MRVGELGSVNDLTQTDSDTYYIHTALWAHHVTQTYADAEQIYTASPAVLY